MRVRRKVILLSFALFLGGCAAARPQATADAALAPPEKDPHEDQEEPLRVVAVGTIEVLDFDAEPSGLPQAEDKDMLEALSGNSPRQLHVIPLRTGLTTLTVRFDSPHPWRRYRYSVITNELAMQLQEIRRLLADVEGLRFEAYDGLVVLEGELLNPDDLNRILLVQEGYQDVLLNLARISPEFYRARARHMEDKIHSRFGLNNVRVEYLNGTYVLHGEVPYPADEQRAEELVASFLPEYQGSEAVRENVLFMGAKKFAIRSLLRPQNRAPASEKGALR